MAWKEVRPMEERISFVLEEERGRMSISELCREYGISRKTGHKWINRYARYGLSGIRELSRRPHSHPNRIDRATEKVIVLERSKHPSWGPKKLRWIMEKDHGQISIPCEATIGNVLRRNNLSKIRRKRRKKVGPSYTPHTIASHPNEVWASDFKGWFRTRDGRRCDPLTISDIYSRYILGCRIVRPTIETVKPVYRRIFGKYGIPAAIRVDNGSPFASRGVCGLSRLSAWWVQLGIRVEFIEPGHPEQNGVHERMHRTLKAETARPPAASKESQQRRFNRWVQEFNHERPHESLGMTPPGQLYERSLKSFPERLEHPEYPGTYRVRKVRQNGEIKWKGNLYYIGEALSGMSLGIKPGRNKEQKIYFDNLFLGIIDSSHPGSLRPPASESQDGRSKRKR